MKKIFMTFSTAATFAAAVVLTSCNNAEEIKKQTEAQANAIQTAVDEKLNGLKAEVDAECIALVDSLANIEYTAFLEESKKGGKKTTTKAKTTTTTTTNPKADRFKDPSGGKTVTKEQTESKGDRFKDPNAPKTVTEEDTKKKAERFRKP